LGRRLPRPSIRDKKTSMWNPTGLIVSLILIAVGAILVWAVEGDPEGLDIDVVGVVLMIVGLVAFLLTLLLWSSWGPGYGRRRRVVYDDDPYARRTVVERPAPRRTVVEEEDVEPPAPPAGPPPPP
jgi:Na+/melibiose symporter-like transporter